MPLDPAALPLLMAGPILRRVEADLVSVWIATSRRCDVSLLLFDGGDVLALEDPRDDGHARWISSAQSTLQVGAHLHVLTVVLDLKSPGGNAVLSRGPLEANSTYSYDLRLVESGQLTQASNLRTLGLLDNPIPLGYDRDELPSFRTPPLERDQLVILHGSCRQLFAVPPVQDDPAADDADFRPPPDWPTEPPTPDRPVPPSEPDAFPEGDYPLLPKRDGMLWVDALIDQRGPGQKIAGRPHQLFLTGDQIYADQVPEPLLPALNNLARTLVGEEDLGASPGGDVFKPATLQNFPPGFRKDIVDRSAGFTTSSGSSHLFSFGEFIAYYLLAWSPELWTIDLWPALEDFDPSQVQMPEDWRVRFLFEDNAPDAEFTDAYKELRARLHADDSPLKDASADEQAAFFFEKKRDWITSKYLSPERFEWWMRKFRGGLPRVRRALANVPTYMIADDHDISDDWYYSRQWRERVFTRPLGVDIIRNGMMAYTLAQAWGNDPRRWAKGPELQLLGQIVAYGVLAAGGSPLPRQSFDRLHELLGLPRQGDATGAPAFRPLVEYSYQIEGPCHRVLVIDGRTKRRFPFRTSQAGGIDYEGATGLLNDSLPTGLPGEEATGLFGDSPMAAALPPRPAGDTKLTIVVAGVPVIGPEGMELALVPFQRLARVLLDVDAEAWSYEPATYEALLAAMARYESVVLLSGDIHVGYSAVLDYWSAPDGEPVRTARIAQLVSSGLTKDWGDYAPALRGHALTLDVFEAATTSTLMHAERLGWGSPLRTSLTPPPALGTLVTNAERAHPSYRARLKMRAPVVPTHGWPEGTQEVREPNWAWRAVMARDDRLESTSPPTIDTRWTPVELPPDPIDPGAVGWHAQAARRMSFGRVFATNPNIGVVTFEPDGENWSVRHVIAGELPPLADTGAAPSGLQPFIVHRFNLAPPAPETWVTNRPKIVDDGGWNVDTTEPAFRLLVECLPRIWQGAAGFAGAVFDELPPVMDSVTREALLTDAASRVSTPFRRRVLRELGPFATLSDSDLDAVTDAEIAALLPQVGRLDVDKEARALVRPDLVRLLEFHQSLANPAAMFDDLLLLACSDWVNERNRPVSLIAGVLATFRSPVTKHFPVLAGLLSGLWDLWRNRTYADYWNSSDQAQTLGGLMTTFPRVFRFAFELLKELVINVVADANPRRHGGPPIFTPELLLTAIGAWQGISAPNRFTFVSGWEPREAPVAPGTRASARTPDAMARQTLSVLIHPGERARFTPPARRLSITMVPPPPASTEEDVEPGSLVVGWDGGLQADIELGAGVIERLELDGQGFWEISWRGNFNIEGRAGATLANTLLRPTRFELLPGADIRYTPAVSASIGFTSAREEGTYKRAFKIRVALNDAEDRISFLPDDELLAQFLPTDGITLPLDAAIEWTPEDGWLLAGLAQGAGSVLVNPPAGTPETPREPSQDFDEPPTPTERATEVVTPLNTRLGVLSVHERRFEVTTEADGEGASLNVSVSATVSVNVGPVRLAFSGLGLTTALHLSSEFENVDELFDLTVGVRIPNGISVSVDADVVSGGGFLQRVESPDGVVTRRGAVALRLAERFDVTAFGVIQTGGGRPWNLLALLAVRFSPPIHLTAGLKLTAVGGLIALNRTMDVNALRDAATGSQNSNLDALLFPERPEERFLELLPALERFFPPAQGHQVVGLLAEIEWRAETGTKFGYFRAALLGELDRLQFGLYGTAQIGLPKLDEPHILSIRASIEALYDHREKFVRASLTIIEALLFEQVHLTGGAALLVRRGARDELAFTLGGFHPSFRPFIPEGLREPPRLGAYWKPHRLVEFRVQAYFALTSTSLQFGYAAHIEAGASWGGIRADTEFNYLVMTEPNFRFEIDLSFRVTAFLFGADLISASLSGSMVGPCPWVFEASISWEVCGASVSKDLGPYEWGERRPQIPMQVQEARHVLGDALADPANWIIRRNPRLPVRLRAENSEVLDPRDQIDVRQARLPLGVSLEVHEANELADRGEWTLRAASGGLAKLSDLTDVFPTRRYLKRPPKETPFRDGLVSGARLGGTGWTLNRELAIGSDEDLTEDLILDSLPEPPRRTRTDVRVLVEQAILVAAPAQASERKWTRHAVVLEAVA